MLTNRAVHPTLPAVDLQRAKKFYEEKLGLKAVAEDSSNGLVLQAGRGTMMYLYQRGQTKADHTVAEFEVENLDAEMKDLRAKGVKFEDYDIPAMGIKTMNGVASMSDGSKGAWFKDSEGNILALNQMSMANRQKMERMMASEVRQAA